jgi:hypothetical protein
MGYWDPKKFPTVSAFARLERKDQNMVVRACRQSGMDVALDALEWLKPDLSDEQE